MKRIIYADNAATTPVSKEVLEEMLPFFTEYYGNPSSVYSVARGTKTAVDKARKQVSTALACSESEVYFTAGGSESDNWAIKGAAKYMAKKGKTHLITTKIEHHAVLHTMQALEKDGFSVTYLDCDEYGIVSPSELEKAITSDTALVSIMYANNEIGTIMPIKELGEVCRKHNVLFHTDAVQAIGCVNINVKEQNIDLLSLSGHKFNAPKGVGALYIKSGLSIENLIHGGAQERRKRAGTENVAGIVGLGKAIEIATCDIDNKICQLLKMRDFTIKKLSLIVKSYLNGHKTNRLPGNVNFCFEGIEGEGMLLMLDMYGICASSGSACTSGSLDPSHVLLAIGRPHEIAHGSLRITYSLNNTIEDAEFICEKVAEIVSKLRSMSPVWDR